MAKVSDYRTWCREQMRAENHPPYGSRISVPVSNDYIREIIGGHRVPDDYQEMWHWIVDHSVIEKDGRMVPKDDLPRFYADEEDDEAEFRWHYGMLLCEKWIGRDGVIRYAAAAEHDDPNEKLRRRETELMNELKSLGFLYDDYENYGSGPDEIPFNNCFVNKDGERRRMIDAPSYGR